MPDVVDAVIDRADESQALLPSAEDLRFVGARSVEEFVRNGHEFLGYAVRLGGLQPQHRVLDIGSGIGRFAIPLTRYLDKTGSYEGIEPDRRGVDWCQKTISPAFPNFNFQFVDFYNSLYNVSGTVKTEEYRLPWGRNEFHAVVLMSIFTHLVKSEVQHYITEIARVLKPGGFMLATTFLLDEESKSRMLANDKGRKFVHEVGGALLENPNSPADAVAYKKDVFLQMLECGGLEIDQLHVGAWSGGDGGPNWQDMVIARPAPKKGFRKVFGW